MLNRTAWLSFLGLSLALSACRTKTTSGAAADTNAEVPNTGMDTEEADSGDIEDTGDGEEEDPEILRLEGTMDVEYTYNGSLGEFTDTCSGDAFIAVDADDVLDGEGTCANAVITFNFTIDGARDGESLTGVLVGESAAGRAETPFTGVLDDGQTELTFDHTHAADGEALRLVGTMNLASSE